MNYHLAGDDYLPVTEGVSFAPNQMISCIEMNNVVDDGIPEQMECFELMMRVYPGSGLGPGDNANVTIIDSERILFLHFNVHGNHCVV